MRPGELIVFLLFGLLLLLIIGIIWFAFKKRKKWAMGLTALLLFGYVGYYLYFPALQVHVHAVKYDQVTEYLASNYPDRQFTVSPEFYEEGIYVGVFYINDKETPEFGVALYVEQEGKVEQTGSWTDPGYLTQRELWQELEFNSEEYYTLDKEIINVAKKDEWIDGALSVFALDINGMPAIAIYEYSPAGYSRSGLQESTKEDVVLAKAKGHTFIYIHERYQGETVGVELQNGEIISLKTADYKGKLFVIDDNEN